MRLVHVYYKHFKFDEYQYVLDLPSQYFTLVRKMLVDAFSKLFRESISLNKSLLLTQFFKWPHGNTIMCS